MKPKIAIITGSTREGRNSKEVAEWVLEHTKSFDKASFDILDIKEFNLPFLGTTNETKNIERWQHDVAQYDGFIFVIAEYNHSITGALKNALDLLRDEWHNKAAGIVSYGSAGGARATEHLRNILAELQIATVRTHVLLSLFDDFENFSDFAPRDVHTDNLNMLFGQVAAWSASLKPLR